MTPTTFPLEKFFKATEQIIVGKKHELQLALCCFLSRGHLLIEDLPGMGKTTFVLVLSKLLDLAHKRIQFTNDLLPADIIGIQILNEDRKSFRFHKGPLFCHLVLADELNRGSPKTQSALLQAMEERSVTVDGETYPLPNPFFLIATQNPTEHAGAFPLPESQLDRFMMRIQLGYPQKKEEVEILKRGDVRFKMDDLQPLVSKEQLIQYQKMIDSVYTSDQLLEYIQSLLQKTRIQSHFKMGLSPRCGLLLLHAAKAWAFLAGRNVVLPEDVQAVAESVMFHRLQTQQNSFSQTQGFIQEMIRATPVPI